MIANVWFDRKSGELIYNIEDPRYRLLTVGADVKNQTEVDSMQKVDVSFSCPKINQGDAIR